MQKRQLGLGLWMVWIFASSCAVVTTSQWLGAVHAAAPKLASPEQVQSFWSRYWWLFVKGYHVLEYAVLLLLLVNCFRRAQPGWLAVLAVLYACTDEFHQTFVPARGGHISDVLIDSLGVLLGLATLQIVRRYACKSVASPIMAS